ncbi:hypothetical protein PTSG_03562 [Salpingoeca rosetta]|uniref:Rad60/SUMO-like domain-containing protein n=1 Tax=Salpingoeca rosetta (strain ATCC 50818 / BSB-021) TaxID=946362 RepID=F2U5Y8_SALR5|nr:uncharacterized protein PTSG_03562 [Salpingoeca rosetta]EGD82929.1 hypothetical protein PTSG_03562 [Salpingoeca rosetta]|eukprot:XP_004995293.1 hypothetical protein PTSG_03562 [Salpingoeca rosetta]
MEARTATPTTATATTTPAPTATPQQSTIAMPSSFDKKQSEAKEAEKETKAKQHAVAETVEDDDEDDEDDDDLDDDEEVDEEFRIVSNALTHHGCSMDDLWNIGTDMTFKENDSDDEHTSATSGRRGAPDTKAAGVGSTASRTDATSSGDLSASSAAASSKGKHGAGTSSGKRNASASSSSNEHPAKRGMHTGARASSGSTTNTASSITIDSDSDDSDDEDLTAEERAKMAQLTHAYRQQHNYAAFYARAELEVLKQRQALQQAQEARELQAQDRRLPDTVTITARTRKGTKQKTLGKDDDFAPFFAELRAYLDVGEMQKLVVTYGDEVVHGTDTPTLLQMVPSNLTLEARVVDEELEDDDEGRDCDGTICLDDTADQTSTAAARTKKRRGAVPVRMRAKTKDNKEIECTYYLDKGEALGPIMDAFTSVCESTRAQLRFLFDGDAVADAATPVTLDMELDDENVVDVFFTA